MIKVGINSLVVAALTYGGIMLFLRFPIFPISPKLWAGKYFEIPTVMAMNFVYTICLWAILGAMIALVMLALRPKRIVVYGFASAVTFMVTMNSWYFYVVGNTYSLLLETVLVLTIPYLYSVYVRLARKRHNLSLKAVASLPVTFGTLRGPKAT